MKDLTLTALHMTGDILSDPNRRCVNSSAEDAAGSQVSPTDTRACKWCLTGALCHAMNELGITDAYQEIEIYSAMKEAVGIPPEYSAPLFWDASDILHDVIAHKLKVAK